MVCAAAFSKHFELDLIYMEFLGMGLVWFSPLKKFIIGHTERCGVIWQVRSRAKDQSQILLSPCKSPSSSIHIFDVIFVSFLSQHSSKSFLKIYLESDILPFPCYGPRPAAIISCVDCCNKVLPGLPAGPVPTPQLWVHPSLSSPVAKRDSEI